MEQKKNSARNAFKSIKHWYILRPKHIIPRGHILDIYVYTILFVCTYSYRKNQNLFNEKNAIRLRVSVPNI